jgi:putative ABC transport system permease protein
MKTLSLSLKYLVHKKLNSFLCIVLLTLGIATLTTATLIYKNVENSMHNNLKNIDLVVGAKGSPIQVILSTVYHIDIPTGNIDWHEAQKLMKNPNLKMVVPLALGDNYKGYRIVGTKQNDFLNVYSAKLKEGTDIKNHFDVLLGSGVAKKSGLKIDDTFSGSHGLVMSDDVHTEFPYKVVGIIEETGTVLDRLIVTTMNAVWEIHGHEAGHEHEGEEHHDEHGHKGEHHADEHDEEHEHHDKDEHKHEHKAEHKHDHDEHKGKHQEKEITALLIGFKSPIAAMQLPRTINKETNMQAASPAFETTRVISILGVGIDSLKFFGVVLIISSFLSIFIALLNSISERRYDIAILRAMGKSKAYIFKLVTFEGLVITIYGLITGILLGHVITYFIATSSDELSGFGLSGSKFYMEELCYAVAIIAFSIIASIIPAIKAYRTDVSKTLSDNNY